MLRRVDAALRETRRNDDDLDAYAPEYWEEAAPKSDRPSKPLDVAREIHRHLRQTDHNDRAVGVPCLAFEHQVRIRDSLRCTGDFAEAVADSCFKRAEETGETVRLGDPGIWSTEKPKIRRIVRNYVLLDAEFAAGEKRYPALFELRFGRQWGDEKPDCPALVLQSAGGAAAFHGQIDRVDLVFDESGALSKLVVIDYKGTGRGGLNEEAYAEEIAQNLNCQLPIYAFAAQQFFFGRHNDARLNEMTEAVYHIQDRNFDNMRKQFMNRRIHLNFTPEDGLPMMESFIAQLATNLSKIKNSDFSVDPLDCTYCDFQHICRVDVNALTAAKEDS